MSRDILQRALDALESATAYPGRRAFAPLIAEMHAALAAPAPVVQPVWRPMRTAPKDGTAVLVLVDGSDIPRAVRWLSGPDDRRATEMTTCAGWHMTWDGTHIQPHDGPRYWMHCPDDPDDSAPAPVVQPLDQTRIVALWGDRSDGPSTAEIVKFARAIERAHGITGEAP